MEMSQLLGSSGCHARPHQCLASIKIFKFKEEVSYVHDIFLNVQHRFLAAIDHLEYHYPSTLNGTQHRCDIAIDYPENAAKYNVSVEEQSEVVLDVPWKLKTIES